MAHVTDRWHVTRNGTKVRTVRYGAGKRWQAVWLDPATRKERTKAFAVKVDADAFAITIDADMLRGSFIDPAAGRVTFSEYGEQWRAIQPHRDSTADHVERLLRLHVYPTLGARPLAAIRPSEIQAWLKVVSGRLAPSAVEVAYGKVAAIFSAAVEDRLIVSSPCRRGQLRRDHGKRVTPPNEERVRALVDAAPERWRALVALAAGTGLRHGELLGMTLDRSDFLRRSVRVDRQLVSLPGGVVRFGPPKTAASVRTVPLAPVVVDELARHLERFPARHVQLPDETGETVEADLLFTTVSGSPAHRATMTQVWQGIAAKAGQPGVHLHDLRHFFVSALIAGGASVLTVQGLVGHASAKVTLDMYGHLWPDSEDLARKAVDRVLGAALEPVTDQARTREA